MRWLRPLLMASAMLPVATAGACTKAQRSFGDGGGGAGASATVGTGGTGGAGGAGGTGGGETKCGSDVDCTDQALPACDTATGACVECLTDDTCMSDPEASICEPATHRCVECVDDSTCP